MGLREEMKFIRDMQDPVELLMSNRYLREINFQDSALRDVQCREVSGKAVRLMQDGRIGTAPGALETPLERLLETARTLSAYGRAETFRLPEGDGRLREQSHGDAQVKEVTVEAARDLAERLLQEVGKRLPEWSLTGSVTVGDAVNRLITSRGIDQRFEERAGGFFVQATLPREGDILDVGIMRSAFPRNGELERVVEELVWRARQAETVTDMPAGEYPLLLHPEALDGFLDALSQAVSGRAVFEGLSPLKDKIGIPIFSENISLTDNALDKSLSGYSPFGDEGTIPEPVSLIDSGRLMSFLTNLEYAARMGHPHTGHGSRFPGSLDGSGPSGDAGISGSSWVMNAGDTPFADMMAGISDGVYLVGSYDVWSGNLIGGDISGSTHLAYRIRNGKPDGRIKNMRVSGNLYRMLGEQLVTMSKERPETNACDLRAPFLLIDKVRVA